ncbi:MAG: endonuclease [Proteobacteria bacterium]|nr:endonuclease [Pseudomonadota bacterium]
MAKKYLAETRGRQCEICNNSEWMGKPIPLILDHINGDPEDHRLENVRLVCGNCDMQLPTFAGRNRGKGRKSRGWIDKQHL